MQSYQSDRFDWYGLKSTICAQNRGTRAYYAAKCSHIAKCLWSQEHNLRTNSRYKSILCSQMLAQGEMLMVSRAQFAHKFEVQEHIMQPNARTERNAYGLKSTICAQNRGTRAHMQPNALTSRNAYGLKSTICAQNRGIRAYYAAKCSHIAKCVWSREHNLRTKSRHKSTYARTKSRHKSTICAHKIEAQEHNLCAQNRGTRAQFVRKIEVQEHICAHKIEVPNDCVILSRKHFSHFSQERGFLSSISYLLF